MAGEGLVLDPLLVDPLDELARRISALEQRPKVVPPIFMPSVPDPAAAVSSIWYVTTTGAGFTTAWRSTAPILAQRALAVVHAVTDSGASGEHRVVITNSDGSATSTVKTYAAGSARFQVLGWLLPLTEWSGGDFTVELQHRKTAGANTLATGRPVIVQLESQACAAGGGVWYETVWLP